MFMTIMAGFSAFVSIAAVTLPPAHACACCSNRGQRIDLVQDIDDRIDAQLEMLRFGSEARLAMGERYEHVLSGINDPVADFTISVVRDSNRIAFSLRDAKGRAGTLSMVNPQRITIFEVDPYDTPDTGLGPVLYKEWRITTPVDGDGIFRDNAGRDWRITLILHGRGLSCTDVHHFSHWSLEARGTGTEHYTFHGEFLSGAQP